MQVFCSFVSCLWSDHSKFMSVFMVLSCGGFQVLFVCVLWLF